MWNENNIFDNVNYFEQGMLEYAKKNLAYVNVFIREPFAHKILVSEKISRVSFISDVGGLLGLFMGFSFVSLAEIIYHALTVRAQSFTSLNADLRLDINRCFAFIRWLNGTFP